jgi:hypothetical protein
MGFATRTRALALVGLLIAVAAAACSDRAPTNITSGASRAGRLTARSGGTQIVEFKGVGSLKCMTPKKDSANARMVIEPCSGADDQSFSYNGSKITTLGLCVADSANSGAKGSVIILATCDTTVGQRWALDSTLALRGDSSRCIDVAGNSVANGAVLQLYTCNNHSNQSWDSVQLHPNEPVGLTKITVRPFSAIAEASWSGPYTTGEDSNGTIAVDSTAVATPFSTLQVKWPAGTPGGNTVFQQDHSIPATATQVYLSLWIKMSPGFQGNGSGVNKVFIIWDDDDSIPSNGEPVAVFSAQATDSTSNFQPQIREQDSFNGIFMNYLPNVAGQTGYTFARGQWVHWETLLVQNTPNDSDGVVRVWMNGVKTHDYTNVKWWGNAVQTTQRHWTDLQLIGIWGGVNGTIAHNQFSYYDYLYASGS